MYWNVWACGVAYFAKMFNNNIRCIEMAKNYSQNTSLSWFNNNIRCIEIRVALLKKQMHKMFNNNIRCIEINQMGVFYE